MLMTGSAESNRLALVKPRSTWVITSKTSPMNPIEPLDHVYTHTRGQPLVKDTVKPRLNADVGKCLPELLPRSPNFT
jgi:hypothetical protein